MSWCVAVLSLSVCTLGCDDDKDDAAHDGDHDDEDGSVGHDNDHDVSKMIGPLTGATCPKDSTLTYDNFGKEFFSKYCLRCHSTKVTGNARNGAPADHNFDKLSDIALLAPHIDQYAGSGPDSTNTKMPQSGAKPSDADRKKLSEWLACGAM
jgi:hypothetical protein